MRHTLWQSFEYAGRGLVAAMNSQRTMRIHVLIACAVSAAVMWLELPAAETTVLIVAMAGVMAVELLNTAVEAVVDMHVGGRHDSLGGRAKDMSAAAVLVAAIGAAIVGVVTLGPPVATAVGMGRADALFAGRVVVLLGVLTCATLALWQAGSRR
ncbi:MAG: diacylglycerol kinase family protein [Armatimonadetes bacterium]|nr:diacylglycerol kinase family protein [Armatimonadota bacterium]